MLNVYSGKLSVTELPYQILLRGRDVLLWLCVEVQLLASARRLSIGWNWGGS